VKGNTPCAAPWKEEEDEENQGKVGDIPAHCESLASGTGARCCVQVVLCSCSTLLRAIVVFNLIFTFEAVRLRAFSETEVKVTAIRDGIFQLRDCNIFCGRCISVT